MSNRWKNILIGIFITTACSVIIGLILFLRPTIGDGRQLVNVRFANISGISKGTRVTYAGRPVGQVANVEEIPNARSEQTDNLGRVYSYQLILKIDSSVSLYTSDEISICTSGLMGERSVAIIPKAATIGEPLQKISDQIIYANSIDSFEHTLNEVISVATKAEKIIDHVDHWLEQNSSTLAHAASSMNALLTTANEQNLVGSVKETLSLASDNMRELKSAITDDQLLWRLGSCIANINEAITTFNVDGAPALAHISQITRDLASGAGTLGRMLANDEFYLRVNSLMSKSEMLMNDINHYGLLFQYNKQWKKTRTQKANLASALQSPKEFKDFFESEIDEMGASIGRISEVLNRADQDGARNQILHNAGFQKDVSVLLRQIKALNDAAQLFNQDLISMERSQGD